MWLRLPQAVVGRSALPSLAEGSAILARMGAWGEKAFQNDSALDWLAELESDGLAAIHAILSRVADSDETEYLDVDEGSAAIAAAEIVAATRHGRRRLNDEAAEWLAANASAIGDDDVVLARRAVERVLGGGSELRALWDENGADTEWHADVRALLVMLGGDPKSAFSPRRAESVDENSKQALLAFMAARGLEPDARQQARIEATTDPAELRRWLGRVLTAKSVAEVLDG